MTSAEFSFFRTVVILSCGAVLTCVSYTIFNIIYSEQKSPYIDEIFHIPQAQLYCKNRWSEWNPKITTLPGLYIVSYALLKPLERFLNENFCSVYTLRLTNLIATVLNFFLAYKINFFLEKKYKVKSSLLIRVLAALNVALFPPMYFFTFLYYTDVWSTTFVLLMYNFHLSDGAMSKILGAFSGFMAVLMRQTNIVWVGLMIMDDTWSILSKKVKAATVQDYKFSKRVFQKFISDLNFKNILRNSINLGINILSKTFHNILICVLFTAFIIINKSIVLGDKQAHTATFHLMQNMYFLNFVVFFSWPFIIPEVMSFWKKPPNFFVMLLLIGLCAGLSETNKLEHPYLLADNRHLAFYLWKRVFGHLIMRRMIVPGYVCSAFLLWRLIQKRCHFMFMVMLAICICLNLTPQYLFELRYYIIPFLMCRLQIKQSSAVVLETLFFLVINAAVIHMFINRPFDWVSEPNAKQRFIW